MDEDLYDEFGNYVGPELDDNSDDGSNEFGDGEDMDFEADEGGQLAVEMEGALVPHSGADENRIILNEDKKYYPDADEVYPGVRTITLDEDAQDLSEPIIKPIRTKNFSVLEKEAPSLTYSSEFLASLMNTPTLIRNIAILGHFHHGKTLFVDTLVQATQETPWDPSKEVRYTDTRKDEQERGLSVKVS